MERILYPLSFVLEAKCFSALIYIYFNHMTKEWNKSLKNNTAANIRDPLMPKIDSKFRDKIFDSPLNSVNRAIFIEMSYSISEIDSIWNNRYFYPMM